VPRSLTPIECALLDDVNVPDEQQCDEDHHLDVNEVAIAARRKCFEDDCPGNQKNYFNVEEDEEHRNQVKLDREPLARRTHRVLAALIRHQLGARALALADELGKNDVANGKARRDNEHQQDRQVIFQIKSAHTSLARKLHLSPQPTLNKSQPRATRTEIENHGTKSIVVHGVRRVKQTFRRANGLSEKKIDRQKIDMLLFKTAPQKQSHLTGSLIARELTKIVITGFNTDVEHDGVVYHVQTEDKGLKSPLLLSLVYVGGTILASKRTSYDDLIASGFDEKILAERLQRQHKLICAAIHAGRIEDLKRQTERESATRAKPPKQEEQRSEQPVAAQEVAVKEDSDIIELGSIADFMPPSVFMSPPPVQSESPAQDVNPPPAPPNSDWEQVDYSRVVDYSETKDSHEDLKITLLEEKKFVAGEFVKINLHVGRGAKGLESVASAAISLKILGSSFRPLIFSGKTASDGTVIFYAMLPYFKTGRAAILVSATIKGERAELRRVVHQAGS
jgi:hypothetical protein